MNQPSRDTAAGAAYNELRDLAREQGRPTDELFQLYVLERFLARLGVSEHRDKLVLKGGALLAAYDLRRQTRDIDVQASGVENAEDTVARLIAEVAGTSLADDDGIEFQTESISASTIRDGDRYAGVRVRLAATLARARLTLHIDVSFGDSIVPPAEEILYPSLRGEPFTIKGYRISTVVAEKAVSMLELGDANTRDRDFGDVFRILSSQGLDAGELVSSLEATARYRGVELRALRDALTDLPARRQASWERWIGRTGLTGTVPSSFEDVVDAVSGFLDPVLTGSIISGSWDPGARQWSGRKL